MFAVIRIHGTNNIDGRVKDTMAMMRLKAGNNCVLLSEVDEVKGMILKAKDHITWGEITKETLVKMLEKRLHAKGSETKVTAKNLKEISGVDSFEKLADEILSGKLKLHKHEKLQPVFRLTPPSKGFKSVIERFPRGEIGYRGKEINELIERMI